MSSDKKDTGSKEIWVTDFTPQKAREFRDAVMKEAHISSSAPITIYIDSYGGYVDSLATMIETLDEITNPIITVCMGKAMSCGAMLLSHGDIRFVGPHSRVMVHEVSSGTGGDVHDMKADVNEIARLNEYHMNLLAKNCGYKGYSEIRKFIKDQDGRDCYMDAAAAVKFGIADKVGLPNITAKIVYDINIVHPSKPKIRTAKTTAARKAKKAKRAKKVKIRN